MVIKKSQREVRVPGGFSVVKNLKASGKLQEKKAFATFLSD